MSKNQSREWIVSYTIAPNPADTKYNTHFIVRDDIPPRTQSQSQLPMIPTIRRIPLQHPAQRNWKEKVQPSHVNKSVRRKKKKAYLQSRNQKKKDLAISMDDNIESDDTPDKFIVRQTPTPESSDTAINLSPLKKDVMIWQCRLVGIVKDENLCVHGNFSTVISERNGQTYNPGSVHISLTLLIDEATRQALQHLDDDIKQNRDFLDPSFVSYFGILRSGLKTFMRSWNIWWWKRHR